MSETSERDRRIEDLPAPPTELDPKQAEAVKGGLLPYVEQDNLRRTSSITDGTSNTRLGDGSVKLGDGSVRICDGSV